jgi:hypothetical protein
MKIMLKLLIICSFVVILIACDDQTSTGPDDEGDTNPQETDYTEYWMGEYDGTFQLTEHENGEPSSYSGDCELIIANNGTNRLTIMFRPDDFPNVTIRGVVSSTGAFYAEENDGDNVAALNRSGNSITGTIYDRDDYGDLLITKNYSISVN